jgi:hypothetical protein
MVSGFMRHRRRVASLLLGLVGLLFAYRLLDVEYMLERVAEVGIRRTLDFGPGMILLLAMPAVAPWLAASRDVVRSGLALGAILPAVVAGSLPGRGAEVRILALILVVGLSRLVSTAVWQSEERARVRLALTSIIAGALVVGALATCLFWPVPFTVRGAGPRVLPTSEVILATGLLLLGTFHLLGRRTRALLWFALAGLSIFASPSLGGYSAGCMGMPGPLEFTIFPVLLALSVPLLWAAPLVRYLAGPPAGPPHR